MIIGVGIDVVPVERFAESLLRTPGRYPVVVRNLGLADPANPKLGDGESNRAWLIVGYR